MQSKLTIQNTAGTPFQDLLFGVNMEITRRGFFGGLSAEMLNNRKLFSGTDVPSGWECTGFERITDQPQRSLCTSPFVILRDGEMTQTTADIALRAGKTYEARLWVGAYEGEAQITFGVEGHTKTFDVSENEDAYTALSFVFDGVDLDSGTFVVRVAGCAAVFEMSLMPTDHFYGMRQDVIEQLKQIAPTSMRFPGGCAADHFLWRESMKAPEFRTPTDGTDKSWFLFRNTYDQDCLDIGLNEFMMLCREVGAEPEFTVSLLLSDGADAADLVQYCNGAADTEYGAIRQSLGFDAFDIKLWYIGNEAYFFGGVYRDSGALAAQRTNELVHAMKAADPSISVVLGLTWAEAFKPWNFDFMENIDCPYEYISFHDYIGILPDATQGHNGMATCEMLEGNLADGESMGLNFYRNKLFAGKFDGIRVCADEWNYSWGYDSSNAMLFSNALQFHFLAKSYESYHIVRAHFFMPVNEGMIFVCGNTCKLESTGEMFALLAPHKGGSVIPCDADTDALDILCTSHADGTYYLSVVNRRAEPCALALDGYNILSCTEIRTQDYSFESNDYTVDRTAAPTVSGHSVLFLSLR